MKTLKIVAAPSNDGAIGRLRIIEPMEAMVNNGHVEKVSIIKPDQFFTAPQQVVEACKDADIFWFQSLLSQQFLWMLYNIRTANPKIKLVMDVDDNILNVNPWNPCYERFTLSDIVVDDTLVKMPVERNTVFIRLFETMLMESDAIVVTTPELAKVYYPYNKNVWVMPNCLDFYNWNFPHVGNRQDGKVRIGWMGGNTHLHDWLQVHKAVKETLEENPDTVLEFITTPGIMDPFIVDMPKEQFVFHYFKNYDAHSWRMNVLKPDIAVIPLNDDTFSRCKSDLKFTEYALLGVPVVAQNIPPYSKSIIHGVTGFLANSEAEYKKYLKLLVDDPKLREEIGNNARRWALENRDLYKKESEWYQTFRAITELEPWPFYKEDYECPTPPEIIT